MAHDVFISYSTADKTIADATCATLESHGIRCWMAPRDILPGDDWGGAIVRAISSAKAFVLVFSSRANQSGQITREVERAVNRGIPVIPLRIENVMPTASLEYFINTPHWLDAFHPPLEKHLNYLADVLKHILDGAQGEAPKPPSNPAASVISLLTSRNLGMVAGLLVVVGAAVWLGSRLAAPGPPPPAPPVVPTQGAMVQGAPSLSTNLPVAVPSTEGQGPYASVQGNGSIGSLLNQLGVADLRQSRISVSDVDGIFQVLGCEGLVDTRNFIFASKGLPFPSARALKNGANSYDVDTSQLNAIERVNVDTIEDYGKRANCG